MRYWVAQARLSISLLLFLLALFSRGAHATHCIQENLEKNLSSIIIDLPLEERLNQGKAFLLTKRDQATEKSVKQKYEQLHDALANLEKHATSNQKAVIEKAHQISLNRKRAGQMLGPRDVAQIDRILAKDIHDPVARRALIEGYVSGVAPQNMAYTSVNITAPPILLEGHSDWVQSAVFSPDGRLIATTSRDGNAIIWDAQSRTSIHTISLTRSKGGSARQFVAFSPDGTKVVTGFGYDSAKIWDVKSGEELFNLRHPSHILYDVAFSPDGTKVVTGGSGGWAIWNVRTGENLLDEKTGAKIHGIDFSPDGTEFVVALGDGTTNILNSRTGTIRLSMGEPKNDSLMLRSWLNSVAFSPDGKLIATGSENGFLRVWNTLSGKEVFGFSAQNSISTVKFSPDGKWILTAGGSFRIWDRETGAMLSSTESLAWSAAFDPDSKRVLVGSGDNSAKIYTLQISPEKPPAGNPKTPLSIEANQEVARVAEEEREYPTLYKLRSMLGMQKITEQLAEVKYLLEANRLRAKQGLQTVQPTLHARFEGNPGTGKTTVARAYGEMLKELGFLKGKAAQGATQMPIIEVGGADFMGANAAENMKKAIEDAQGGVLIIDELYGMNVGASANAKQASDILLKAMEDQRDKFVVIGTGYSKEMEEFLGSNDGFNRRFAQKLLFDDYDNPTLQAILEKIAKDMDYQISPQVAKSVIQKVARFRGKGFGNAGTIRNEFEAAVRRQSVRLKKTHGETEPSKQEHMTLKWEDFQSPTTQKGDPLAALEKMTGLDEVKRSMQGIVALLQLEKERAALGLKTERPLLNMVFSGNPGTGKTTVANIVAATLKNLGYLTNGELISIKGSDLIGINVEDSILKTRAALKRAKGNVLFIDETYVLYQRERGQAHPSGPAVLDTLVGEINPDADQDMVVMLAGYSKDMADLLGANAGIARRFPKYFHFADYTEEQLGHILDKKAAEKDVILSEEARRAAMKKLSLQAQAKDFGNAGAVENLLGQALIRQSERLAHEKRTTPRMKAELQELRAEDLVGTIHHPDDVLLQVDAMPGLQEVKDSLHEIKLELEEGRAVLGASHQYSEHMLSFVGHSKGDMEKVSQQLGALLHSLHVLPSEKVSVIRPSDVLGEAIGQSTARTQRAMKDALGKTVLVTNVGALSDPRNSYQREVMETLTHFLEEKDHRGKMVVVFSGAPDEMDRFYRAWPKVKNLIAREVEFQDLGVHESVSYLAQLLKREGKTLSPRAHEKLREALATRLEVPGAGNAALIEELEKKIRIKQTLRAKRTGASMSEVTEEDIEAALGRNRFQRRSSEPDLAIEAGPRSAQELAALIRTRVQEPVVVQRAEVKARKHEEAQENRNALATDAPFKLVVSESASHAIKTMENIVRSNAVTELEMREAILDEVIPDVLLKKMALEKFGTHINEKALEQYKLELLEAIQELKAVAKRERKKIKHRVCQVCDRKDCGYRPIEWFTEEDK
jgi:WD40 repeat protein/DNA polymerase III delta prime subunit